MKTASALLLAILTCASMASLPTHAQSATSQACAASQTRPPWLSSAYWSWLNEDVLYIMAPEECMAFLDLTNDADRDRFIDQFWDRRNPDPGSHENAFEEEHYRRFAYANENFSTPTTPGWKSDRGRIYIEWGPPDSISSPETRESPLIWGYRYLEGLGENVNIEFVQTSGYFQAVLSESLRECLDGCFNVRAILTHEASIPKEPHDLQLTSLEALAASHVARNDFNLAYTVRSIPVTHFTTLVQISISMPRDRVSAPEELPDGEQSAHTSHPEVFCRISNSTGEPVATFESRSPVETLPSEGPRNSFSFEANLPVRPGSYDLDIVAADPTELSFATAHTILAVPSLSDQH